MEGVGEVPVVLSNRLAPRCGWAFASVRMASMSWVTHLGQGLIKCAGWTAVLVNVAYIGLL